MILIKAKKVRGQAIIYDSAGKKLSEERFYDLLERPYNLDDRGSSRIFEEIHLQHSVEDQLTFEARGLL
jgi:hypothetical protein